MTPALVLDLDDSLHALPAAQQISLPDWQERIRFGCGWRTWYDFRTHLEALLPTQHGTVLIGSGDFHHLSHLLIDRQRHLAGLRILVCDNHPDNMRFPFGIHCGSWVAHVARMPHVARVDVVGISSHDVALAHAWENHLRPLYQGRVRYWTIGVDTGWMRTMGLAHAVHAFDDTSSLVTALRRELANETAPLYLSIDKDVLHDSVARTNWDQGRFMLDDLLGVIDAAAPRLVGSDITGEISIHHYRTHWKRWLSAMDGQSDIAASDLANWQRQQIDVNETLLRALSR